MLKKTLRLLLLAALLMPLAAKAQETLTVCDGTETSQKIPFDGWNADSNQHSQSLYLASDLTAMVGKEITQMVYYFNSSYGSYASSVETGRLGYWTISLGETTATTLSTIDNTTTLTQVYYGIMSWDHTALTMTITFDNGYVYNGGNLLVDFNHTKASYNRYYFLGVATTENMAYNTYGSSAHKFQPKNTFTYQTPATCPKPTLSDEVTKTQNTATISWTPSSDDQNYFDIYWSTTNTAPTTETTPLAANQTGTSYQITNLEPSSHYYAWIRGNCGTPTDPDISGGWTTAIDFDTDCGAITTFPWKEDFENYAAGNFSHLCWVNEHIAGSSTYVFTVYTYTVGTNTTKTLQLPDMSTGNQVKLRLPEMTLANDNYEFLIDVYRSDYSTFKEDEGIRVFASTDGEITGATELAFIPRQYTAHSTTIPQETAVGWYTYSLPIGMSGTCYIILRGESKYGLATYIDNFVVRQVPDCAIPAAPVVIEDSETPEGATIAWTPGGDETSWTVQYKKTVETEWTTIETPVTDTTYTFTELSSTTTYQARIIAACTGVTYPSDAVNFTTIDPCQAPKNFKATNITHNSATLSWTKGYAETAWTVTYVKASGDWEDADVVNVENTPTANLTDLEENTTYYVRIAGCNPDNYLSANFKTKDPNAAPTNLVWTVTQTTATLSWTPGYTTQHEWTVEYKKSSDTDYTSMAATDTIVTIDELEGFTTYNVRIYYVEANKLTGSFTTATKTRFLETFSTTSVPTGWARYYGKMSEVLSGKANLSTTTSGWYFDNFNNVFVGGYHAYCTNNDYWLVTPNIELTEDIDLNFDLAFTEGYSASNVTPTSYGDNDTIAVLITADNGATWTPLKVWDNNAATSNAKLSSLSNGADKDTYTQLSLSAYDNQTVKIAFYYKAYSTDYHRMHIDNIDVDEHQDCRTPVLTLGNYLYDRANFSWTNSTGCTWTINYKQHDAEEWTPINNLPTNQYQITGLTAETEYDVRVKASCNKYWSNTVTFTTRNECPTPQNLAANNITHASTNLTWDGWSDSYTVEYRTAEATGDVLLEEYFDDPDEVIDAGWTFMGSGTSNWDLTNTSYAGGDPYEMHLTWQPSFNGTSRLVTPALDLTGISSVMFSFKHYLDNYQTYTNTIGIATSSDDGVTWNVGWSKSYNSTNSYTVSTTIATADMGNEAVRFCIYFSGNSYNINDWYFDDIVIGTSEPAGEWEEATATATAGAYTLGGLDAGTAYDVRVRANCDTEEWCEASFTTYDDDTKIFITSGSWFKASNWDPQIVPDEDNNVIIRAAANILDEAAARHITIEEGGSITIGDGGTLYHRNTGVVATVEKEIAGHGGESGSWNLISTSVWDNILYNDFPAKAENLIAANAEDYDLYRFDGTSENQWINYKQGPFSLYAGCGYLYANRDDITLRFTEVINPAYNNYDMANYDGQYPATLAYDTDEPLGTLTLIGNSFVYPAYIAYAHYSYYSGYQMDSICQEFYVMNDDGDEIVVSEEDMLMPNQGAFIEATSSSQYAANITYDPFEEEMRGGSLSIRLGEGRRKVDMAKVRFGEGRGLTKFQLNENHTKLYIPQGNTDYAVAFNAEAEGEMPLNFRPEKTGQYTITIDAKDMEFSYLHLIDNITGANVDLLTDPSYTFIGSVRDDVNRFRIVFSSIDSNIDVESEVFAYQNGDDIVVSGEGLVQIYDVMGRYVTSFEVNGTRRISAYDYQNAVYIFRLVGNEVKTQKIVVR